MPFRGREQALERYGEVEIPSFQTRKEDVIARKRERQASRINGRAGKGLRKTGQGVISLPRTIPIKIAMQRVKTSKTLRKAMCLTR